MTDTVVKRIGKKYIGDFVYGANDGIITTFAVVSAVTGAALSPGIVVIVGISNLLADGFSMAAGDYLAVSSNKQYRERRMREVEDRIDDEPEQGEQRVREIYRHRGFTGKLLDRVVEKITNKKRVWRDTIIEQEDLVSEDESPAKKGFATFCAFVLAGFMPLLPYAFAITPMFTTSITLTGITLFTVGALRTYITEVRWWRSGFEVLLVGALAAAVAYTVGNVLKGLGGPVA
jgi:VIT1/CCC1 family predicted Fe2+/Mn2+ transporter